MDNVNSVIATLAGSFQNEISCASDFNASCMQSWLKEIDGDGTYEFSAVLLAESTAPLWLTTGRSMRCMGWAACRRGQHRLHGARRGADDDVPLRPVHPPSIDPGGR